MAILSFVLFCTFKGQKRAREDIIIHNFYFKKYIILLLILPQSDHVNMFLCACVHFAHFLIKFQYLKNTMFILTTIHMDEIRVERFLEPIGLKSSSKKMKDNWPGS